jgi:DNA-binding transcriptional MerR regulator
MRREYTLAEVAAAVGMTERNVRAYRSRGLIDPPRMRGRVGYYGQHHLAQLRLVQSLVSHGLSLSVITQLMQRGVAETELARLVRDELETTRPVPLSQLVFDELERAEPGLVGRLADLGLGHRTPQGYRGDPSFFALSNLLVALGVEPLDVARVSQRTAESVQQLADALPELTVPADVDDPPTPEQVRACVVELASTAFRLSLAARLERDAAVGVREVSRRGR